MPILTLACFLFCLALSFMSLTPDSLLTIQYLFISNSEFPTCKLLSVCQPLLYEPNNNFNLFKLQSLIYLSWMPMAILSNCLIMLQNELHFSYITAPIMIKLHSANFIKILYASISCMCKHDK